MAPRHRVLEGMDDLSSYEADILQQQERQFPALNARQAEDHALVKKSFAAFLAAMAKTGKTEQSLLEAHGNEAFGHVLGYFLEFMMLGEMKDGKVTRYSVGLRYFEIFILKQTCLLIREKFPSFSCYSEGYTLKSLRDCYEKFKNVHDHWCACVGGGSKAEAAVARLSIPPAFAPDSRRLMSSTEPTARGIRLEAAIAVLADTGLSVDTLYVAVCVCLSTSSY